MGFLMDIQRKLEILADTAKYNASSIRAADLGPASYLKAQALPFLVLSDHPSPHLLDAANLVQRFKPNAAQLGFGF
jgi:hypothetical protein